MDFRRKLLLIALVLFLNLIVFTVCFMIIQGWNFIDSFFFVLITITTIGYGIDEHHHYSAIWKICTSLLIMTGIGIFFYSATYLIELF